MPVTEDSLLHHCLSSTAFSHLLSCFALGCKQLHGDKLRDNMSYCCKRRLLQWRTTGPSWSFEFLPVLHVCLSWSPVVSLCGDCLNSEILLSGIVHALTIFVHWKCNDSQSAPLIFKACSFLGVLWGQSKEMSVKCTDGGSTLCPPHDKFTESLKFYARHIYKSPPN